MLSRESWARSRVAQLTAGYAVSTYGKPPLYYMLGASPAARGQTDGQTRLTNQPTGQHPFCQYPLLSCKLGNKKSHYHLLTSPNTEQDMIGPTLGRVYSLRFQQKAAKVGWVKPPVLQLCTGFTYGKHLFVIHSCFYLNLFNLS